MIPAKAMIRANRHILSISLVVLTMVGGISLAAPQAADNRPLSWEQVLEYWRAESAEILRKNITRERVTQLGVAFVLDDAREKELQRLKMAADLINEIRKQNRTATLIVECEPDCSVAIDKQPAGNTPAKQWTRSVLAGPVNIEVSAPPAYAPKMETLTIAPGEVARRVYKLDLVKGFLNLQCEPDCSALVTGPNGYEKKISTTNTRGHLNELPDGQYTVRVEADGFKPASTRFAVKAPNGVTVNFKLVADEWAGKPATEVLDLITKAVGDPRLVLYAVTSKNDGRMRLTGDPSSIGNWTAEIEESAVPDKLRWNLKLSGGDWTVAFDGTTARSKGNKRFAGTEFSRELEQSIRKLVNLRLPSALIRVRSGFELQKSFSDDASVLIASSAEDRYTFYVDENFLPKKLLHERLIAPRSQEAVEFEQYREVQAGLRLPYVMILRYPDRPKHEQVFEFETIDPGLALKDQYFAKP